MKSYKLFVWNSCVPHVQTLLFWKCSSKEYAFLKLPVWKSYYTQTVLQLLYNSCVNVSKLTHVQRFFPHNMKICMHVLLHYTLVCLTSEMFWRLQPSQPCLWHKRCVGFCGRSTWLNWLTDGWACVYQHGSVWTCEGLPLMPGTTASAMM